MSLIVTQHSNKVQLQCWHFLNVFPDTGVFVPIVKKMPTELENVCCRQTLVCLNVFEYIQHLQSRLLAFRSKGNTVVHVFMQSFLYYSGGTELTDKNPEI